MSSKISTEKIKAELAGFKKYNLVIYGSYIGKNFNSRSDIDIALITTNPNPAKNKKIWLNLMGKVPEKYDFKVFELLPLDIKASLINNYIVIYGDSLGLSEYFYHFRKLWKDCQKRYSENLFSTIQEKLKALTL